VLRYTELRYSVSQRNKAARDGGRDEKRRA
jgi:hypothetical protein